MQRKKYMLTLPELKSLLATPQQIVITTHHKPDGDAMGSSLGLYGYLIQKGHHVKVITPTDYPAFLHWMPNNSDVIIFTEEHEKAAKLVAEAALIFCLDFNTLSRINELGELVRAAGAKKVMIDHHLEPEDFHDEITVFRPICTHGIAFVTDIRRSGNKIDLVFIAQHFLFIGAELYFPFDIGRRIDIII